MSEATHCQKEESSEKSVFSRQLQKHNISRGIIEFDRKASATRAIEQVNNGCFFLTKSPRAIVCAQIEAEDADDGLREVKLLFYKLFN